MSKIEQLFSIAGKTALVTGGGSGIGLMIARAYVECGVRVYIASRKLEVCAEVAEELSGSGECIALQADLSTEAECNRLAAEIGEREPGLDILVNNAGATWGAPYHEFPAKAWDRVLDLNVKGVFFLTRALTPKLSAAGSALQPARVINVGSAEGCIVPAHENYPYPVSKAAVHWMTRILAKRLAREHITVNGLVPGAFESHMMAATLAAMGDEIAAMSPLHRIGSPDDIAGAAIYLASPAASWITGVNLPVDGGISTTV